MASAAAMCATRASEDFEQLLPSSSESKPSSRHVTRPAVATILAGLASIAGASLLVVGFARVVLPQALRAPGAPPITVRALLASDELKDLTTDNLMALHGDALATSGREHVRDQVSHALARVDASIEQLAPEAHRQLCELELSDKQKDSAMRVLRKFGDSRMVGLGHAISEAIDENAREAGDDESLKRRLSEKLGSKVGDLSQLNSEMFPNRPASIDMSSSAPALGSWHPKLEVDFGKMSQASAVRRLAVLDGISGGVNTHAQTLFESLHGELGEKMPRAPARVLSLFGDAAQSMDSANSGATAQTSGEQSFMACVQGALPEPTKLVKCLADHMGEVISMVMKVMQGMQGGAPAGTR